MISSGTPAGSSTPRSARASSIMARVEAMLVAQLHQRGAAGDAPGEIGQRAAAGDGGIDKRVEPEIDVHQFTRARAMRVAPSRLWRASRIATAKLPGPCALAPASSPATPTITSAPAVARQASASTRDASRHQRRGGAAHGGDLGHQRMAVGDRCKPPAVADPIGLARQREHGFLLARISRQRFARWLAVRQRGKFGAVEPYRLGGARDQFAREHRARRRCDR